MHLPHPRPTCGNEEVHDEGSELMTSLTNGQAKALNGREIVNPKGPSTDNRMAEGGQSTVDHDICDNVVENPLGQTLGANATQVGEELEELTGEATMDLSQFSQWTAEHQVQLLREVIQQQQWAQAAMKRALQQSIVMADQAAAGGGGRPQASRGLWLPLTQLGPEDEIEAFLEPLECAVEAAKWPKE
ncbi:UNVERIFIED_CONTAM: hypothetical protein K2H54_012059 [Gekko kuhli]